jgi:hypothetical protein
VGTDLVVVLAPALDLNASVGQGLKPVGAQAFVPEAAVEALDVGILHRFARSNEDEFNPAAIGPEI